MLRRTIDKWLAAGVMKPRLRGRAFMIRYADDLAMVFANEADARVAKDMLAERLGLCGLSLHPTKTRLVEFRPRGEARGTDSRSFDFLGFTHYWARSRRKGSWMVMCKTASRRFRRTLKRLSVWCRRHRHQPIAWQHARIVMALRGHYNYFGIPGNMRALERLRRAVEEIWQKWLNRRSQNRHMRWARFAQLLKRYPLPRPVLR